MGGQRYVDFSAVNVEFSPPGSTHAQLTVFITNLGEEAQEDSEPLVDVLVRLFYDDEQAPFKEVAREPQLDGSMRLSGVLQAPGASTQHNDFLQREGLYFVALRTTLPSDPTSLRTLTRIVNSFQLNTDVPWQGAVQGLETTVRRGAVSFSSLNTWSGSNDSFSIAGQVLNNASSSLEFVRVSAKLYDSNNELVDEKGDFIAADVVQPGEFSPFVVLFPDGLPAGTVRYELAATARYADFAAETFYGPSNFDVVDSADFDTNGLLVISGQVTNIGGPAGQSGQGNCDGFRHGATGGRHGYNAGGGAVAGTGRGLPLFAYNLQM